MMSNRTPPDDRCSDSGRRVAPSASAAVALLLSLSVAPGAQALEITLPAETAQYRASDLPGYQLAQRNCMICHSAQYAMTQPPGSPRSYWEATVKKMKNTFGAPLPEDAIAPIADYLVKTYGAEQPQKAGDKSAGAAMPAAPTTTAGSLNENGSGGNGNDTKR